MSNKIVISVLVIGSLFSAFMSSPSLALQSGGVEIGDLETGSVVGQPFTELEVAATLTAICVGGHKAWYPPIISLNLGSQTTGSPVLIKVTNLLSLPQGFRLSLDTSFASPTSMLLKVRLMVNPGESKYIGIPISDLTFVTAARVGKYDSYTDEKMHGGEFFK